MAEMVALRVGDVDVFRGVQKCFRRASAKVTLDAFGHLWPDKEESARAAVQSVLAAHADSVRTRPASALISG